LSAGGQRDVSQLDNIVENLRNPIAEEIKMSRSIKCLTILVLCSFICGVPLSHGQKVRYVGARAELTIGDPVFIPYARAFALLDGLFQDVSAIKVKQITAVAANYANATRLDAVIQHFQASIQYNHLLDVQNAAAARQSAIYSASWRLSRS
jgi:hypothetical protein